MSIKNVRNTKIKEYRTFSGKLANYIITET